MLHLYRGKIIVDKENLPDIPEIRKIVDTFKAEDATKLLMYMYLMYDRSDQNPLKEFPTSERSGRAKEIAFKDNTATVKKLFPKDINLISKAFKSYEKSKVDKIQRDIDLYDKKMYQFIDLLKRNEPKIIKNTHDINEKVSFSTNIGIITTVLDNSINIILDKAALTMMKKTGKFSNGLRGSLSPNAKGKLKNIKK